MTETMEQLLTQRAQAQAVVDAIDAKIDQRKGQTLVRCEDNVHGSGCKKAFPIAELEYIQTLSYVRPTGCTEGGYWANSEGNWECPECGHRNRLYDKPDIEALKSLFKSSREEKNSNR